MERTLCIICLAIALMVTACSKNNSTKKAVEDTKPKAVILDSRQPSETPIDLKAPTLPASYTVLRRWTPHDSGLGMELLVDSSATKDEVMALANDLFRKYEKEKFVFIHIFDSKDAWRNRSNESYPEAIYFKHFLATITINHATGFKEIAWVARGRAR